MTDALRIDSNIVGLRYAHEVSPKKLPASPDWIPLEVNSYTDFGATLTRISRNPINPSRQREKGSVTDLEAVAGFNLDLTQSALEDLSQGFLAADAINKPALQATSRLRISIVGNQKTYGYTVNAPFPVTGLIFVSGFSNPQNNGLKTVTKYTQGTGIVVAEDLVDETSTTVKIQFVGFSLNKGQARIKADAGEWPYLEVGNAEVDKSMHIGEWIYIGGDAAENAFQTPENNGYKRVRKLEGTKAYFDKFEKAMVTDDGANKKIHLFFANIVKNQTGDLVRQRTYQLERTLGAPDVNKPTEIQCQYITGARANELTMTCTTGELTKLDMNFVGADEELRDGPSGFKPGDLLDIVPTSAFSATGDIKRIKMAGITESNITPKDLFSCVSELNITINNNVTPLKCVGTLGSFDSIAGNFEVSGSLTAYFTNVEALQAIRNNANVTLDVILAKENSGILIDMPLIELDSSSLDIAQNSAVMVPINFDASRGRSVSPDMDYTLMFCFFPYLPNRAAGGGGII